MARKTKMKVKPDLPTTPQLVTNRPKAKVISRKIMLLDHKAAKEYLALPPFEGERPVDPDHVTKLAMIMANDMFNWEPVDIVSCIVDGVEYKTNGQHTCEARLQWEPGDFPNAFIDRYVYQAETMRQVKDLYGTYDSGKPRNYNHVVKAILVGESMSDGIAKDLLAQIVSGLAVWQTGGVTKCRPSTLSADQGVKLAEEHENLFRAVGQFLTSLGQSNFRLLTRQAVIASLFATFDIDCEAASCFWKCIAMTSNLVVNTPPWALQRYLVRTSRDYDKTDKRSVKPGDLFGTCINMWNKWCADPNTEIKVANTANQPPRKPSSVTLAAVKSIVSAPTWV